MDQFCFENFVASPNLNLRWCVGQTFQFCYLLQNPSVCLFGQNAVWLSVNNPVKNITKKFIDMESDTEFEFSQPITVVAARINSFTPLINLVYNDTVVAAFLLKKTTTIDDDEEVEVVQAIDIEKEKIDFLCKLTQ